MCDVVACIGRHRRGELIDPRKPIFDLIFGDIERDVMLRRVIRRVEGQFGRADLKRDRLGVDFEQGQAELSGIKIVGGVQVMGGERKSDDVHCKLSHRVLGVILCVVENKRGYPYVAFLLNQIR